MCLINIKNFVKCQGKIEIVRKLVVWEFFFKNVNKCALCKVISVMIMLHLENLGGNTEFSGEID